MSLPSVTTQFIREFENFDRRCVNAALASLAADAALLEPAQRRLGLPARLTLITRLAMVRADKESLASLDRVIEKGVGLQQKYEELTRSGFAQAKDTGKPSSSVRGSGRPGSLRVWLPTEIEICDAIEETGNLKRMLQGFVDRCRTGAAATVCPTARDNRVHNAIFSPAAF